jgi:hypothetical protein
MVHSSPTVMFLNPIIIHRTTKNPFTLKERNFPVDIPYPWDVAYTVKIDIPNGFIVKDLPKSVYIRGPRNDIEYRRIVVLHEGEIQLVSRFINRRMVFLPKEYKELRAFYDRIVSMESEMIVFEKIPEPERPETSRPKLPGTRKRKPPQRLQ